MQRSRFTEEQIIGVLKEQQAGVSVVDLCRKYGCDLHPIFRINQSWCFLFSNIPTHYPKHRLVQAQASRPGSRRHCPQHTTR